MFRSFLWAACGTGFIFLMSILGSAVVFFFGGEMKLKMQSLFMGFASGVRFAAAVWRLLIPAMEQGVAFASLPCWLPAIIGIAAGTLFLSAIDSLLRRLCWGSALNSPSNTLLVTAITLHNIPEGMAVGLAFALAADGEGFAAAVALAAGIGIQNFPEGAAVSLPMRQSGMSRPRSFFVGVLSGSVEPLFGLLAVLAVSGVQALMPWLLSFAAGAMLYVCVQELIPCARGRSGIAGFTGGFMLMMVLDVALG